MTQRKRNATKHKRWPWVAVVIVIAFVAVGVGGWLLVSKAREAKALTPPAIPSAKVEPGLATSMSSARQALVANRKSAAAWGELGKTFHAAEFFAEARICYSNAAFREPRSYKWLHLKGLTEVNRQPDDAVNTLTRAVELAGTDAAVPRYQLARALNERGRHNEAASHLTLILAANPAHAGARVELARAYIARRQLREATMTLQPAMTNSYTMRAATLLAAQIAQQNGQQEFANQLARRAATLPIPAPWPDPLLREVLVMRIDRVRMADQVNALLQQQRTADAEGLLRELLQANPNDTDALLLMGRLRYQEGKCVEAEAIFRQCLEANTNSLNALVQLGIALLCQQQWSNAVPILQRAVSLKQDFAQAHANLGLAYSRLGEATNSIRSYRNALRSSPGDINSHMALAEELANVGDLEGAKEHVRMAAAINPDDARVKAGRAQLQMEKN